MSDPSSILAGNGDEDAGAAGACVLLCGRIQRLQAIDYTRLTRVESRPHMTPLAHLQQGSSEASERFKTLLKEWVKDHHMFASTLQELTGQLALLQPPPQKQKHTGGSKGGAEPTVLQRVADRAPSDRLAAYAAGKLNTGTLQRGLPEQLDQNLRLLGVLAAEMRRFVGQMEAVADASAAQAVATVGLAEAGSGGSTAALEGSEGGCEAALLMVAVLEGVGRETALIERAAEGMTLTSPPEEVSAAATVIQLQPFVDDTLLAAALEEGEADEEQQREIGRAHV